MLTTLTHSQMLTQWRQRLGYTTLPDTDPFDINTLLSSHIRAWYDHLLLTQPPSLLPVEELKSEITSADIIASSTAMLISLPSRAIRPISLLLDDWDTPLTQFALPGSDIATLQQDPLLRATPDAPVAILNPDRTITAYGITDPSANTRATVAPQLNRRILSLRAVATPSDPDTYTLHTSLLNTIPTQI